MAQASFAPCDAVPTFPVDRGTKLIVAGLAAVAFLVHFRIAPGYTYFRDELYFIACAARLDWGYVDHPAGAVLITWLVRRLSESLVALRVFPALTHAGAIIAVGELTRLFGGRRYAIGLACLAVLIGPIYLAGGGFLSASVLDCVLWATMMCLATRILLGGSQKLWLWFGLLGGIALEMKLTMLPLAFSLVGGLMLAGRFESFRKPWIWLGGAIALALFAPYLAWNAQHGWTNLELYGVANQAARTAMSLKDWTFSLIVMLNPITIIIWAGGVAWLLLSPRARPYRSLGFAFVVYYVLMMALHAKTYYLAAGFLPAMAAGAVAREEFMLKRPHLAWLKTTTVLTLIAFGVWLAPLAMPLVTAPRMVTYLPAGLREPDHGSPAARTILRPPLSEETGWPEMAARVADAYRTLTPAEQRRAAIYATSYGQAAAIELFGRPHGLPPVVSGHNTYYVWGPGAAANADVLILVGERKQTIARECGSVTTAAVYYDPYGRAFDNGPILVCRDLRRPLAELWPQLRVWGQD